MASAAASASGAEPSSSPPPATAAPTKTSFLNLPPETQKEVVGHSDLICLALVSRHFRDLAAAQLYRNFHIVFPDEDDPSYDSPIDGLAGGLDTFVTSDYNYAKHLKDLSLDTLSAGDKAETAYKPYVYSLSCGKFMNTLLLLTLRKAQSLETFRWNIRVELSRPVYKALHQIESLGHVHIRMQAGPSLYEAPPPLPYSSGQSANAPPPPTAQQWPEAPASLPPPPPPPPVAGFGNPSLPTPASYFPPPPPPDVLQPPPLPKSSPKARPSKKASPAKEPPTLSGFKKLKSLAVLDIDSLDLVTEIKTCVRNSASTLTKLKLSFSDSLASQARRPPPDNDPEDSDQDDEFQVVPVLPANQGIPDDATGPAKAFRAQEEKKSQEAVLGRVFDVEPYVVKTTTQAQRSEKEKETAAKEEPSANPGQDFVNAIRAVSNKLMTDIHGSEDISQAQQEVLDMIEKAARKYVGSEEVRTSDDQKSKEAADPEAAEKASPPSSSEAGPSSSDAEAAPGAKEASTPAPSGESSAAAAQESESTMFASKSSSSPSKAKDADGEMSPEDINIEEPEEQLAIEPQEAVSSKDDSTDAEPDPPSSKAPIPDGDVSDPQPPAQVGKAVANLVAQKANFETLVSKLEYYEGQANLLCKEIQEMHNSKGTVDPDRVQEAEKQLQTFSRNIQDVQNEMHIVEAEIDDAGKQIPAISGVVSDDSESSRVTEYVRSTRGMALQSLSIHLIPVKAGVLSNAVDFRVLWRITLLNVGNQAPIWSLLAKENKVQPLPLRKIFTDNVSPQFLTFLSQLEALHELFLLERGSKYKPESFAPKTEVTIDHIRRLALKKHLPTLKRVLIRHDGGQAWDADEKTMLLICKRGKKLEELAVSMGIRAIHTMMQHICGLSNLRALHIQSFRNDDTCVWVMRETRRFIIDNLSHYPDLKLEWLAIDDDRVERILRPADLPKKSGKKKGKGKEKTAAAAAAAAMNLPMLSLDPLEESSESEDEAEIENLKLETLDGIQFYDVWGVRIFKKEVLAGRL